MSARVYADVLLEQSRANHCPLLSHIGDSTMTKQSMRNLGRDIEDELLRVMTYQSQYAYDDTRDANKVSRTCFNNSYNLALLYMILDALGA